MTDQQLLELAAKAAGYEFGYINDAPKIKEDRAFGSCGTWGCTKHKLYDWNPLVDDGDALRLAVKLRLEVGFPKENVVWSFGHTEGDISKEFDFTNPYAATRRAIVRAAAEIGENMKYNEKEHRINSIRTSSAYPIIERNEL